MSKSKMLRERRHLCRVSNAYFYSALSWAQLCVGGGEWKSNKCQICWLHKCLGLKASLQFEESTFHIPKFTWEVWSAVDNVSTACASSVFQSLYTGQEAFATKIGTRCSSPPQAIYLFKITSQIIWALNFRWEPHGIFLWITGAPWPNLTYKSF